MDGSYLSSCKGGSAFVPSSRPPPSHTYTRSRRKINLEFARLAASMELRTIRGHSARHTQMSYFLEPEPPSRLERSAATTSAASGTSLGFRLTNRTGSLRAVTFFDKLVADRAARSEDGDQACMLPGLTESPQENEFRRRI